MRVCDVNVESDVSLKFSSYIAMRKIMSQDAQKLLLESEFQCISRIPFAMFQKLSFERFGD